MKAKIFLPILLLLGGFMLFQACKSSKDSASKDTAYSCPMHPEMRGKKGDHCSTCKMAMTKSDMSEMGCCPMHKECVGKAGTKCPKCSMPMDHPVQVYSCPMHPDQKGKKGDHCPKCQMELKQVTPMKGQG